jgi:hypothetical protein
MRRMNSLRTAVMVVGAASVLAVAACGGNSAGSAGGTAATNAVSSSASPGSSAPAQPLRPGERFVDLAMSKPYTPVAPNGGTDEYRCLVIDPHLARAEFLTGTQFQPGNVPIVHHAIVFAIPPDNAAVARAKDAAGGGQGWTCFGNDAVGNGKDQAWVDTWTPGASEVLLKQNAGFPLQPGSLIVVQIHYNLLATGGRPGGSDKSSVRLRLTDGTADTKSLVTVPLQAPIELPCASNESGPLCNRTAAIADVAHRFGPDIGATEARLLKECGNGAPVPGNTQHCDVPVEQPMTIYAALGHMHLLGRSIKIELNPGTAKAQTLLDVKNFNFDYQRLTPLPTAVDVGPGDTLRVTCTHDATLRQKLPQLNKLPPRYVVWGDGTSDEMCLGLLTASVRS